MFKTLQTHESTHVSCKHPNHHGIDCTRVRAPLLPQDASRYICISIKINFADWNFIHFAIDLSMKKKNFIAYKLEMK